MVRVTTNFFLQKYDLFIEFIAKLWVTVRNELTTNID